MDNEAGRQSETSERSRGGKDNEEKNSLDNEDSKEA